MEVFMIYKRNSAAREAALDVAKKMVAAAITAQRDTEPIISKP